MIKFSNISQLIVVLLFVSTINAQEAKTSLAMFSQAIINPAYVGSSEFGDAYLGWRNQYMDLKDESGKSIGPTTLWFAVNAPIKKLNSGIGISYTKDEIGFEKTQDIELTYAYQLKISDGKLGLGINVGYYMFGYDFGDERYPNQSSSDPYISVLKENNKDVGRLNTSFGIYYSKQNLYFGVSAKNLNEPKFELAGASKYNGEYLVRHYYMMAGYYYQTSNPAFALVPSLTFKTVGASASQLNADLVIDYNKFIVGGISWVTSNDFSAIIGVKIRNGSKFDGIRAIIAYDLITSDIGGYSSGNVEFNLGYSFNLSVEKAAKTYKSVRFL